MLTTCGVFAFAVNMAKNFYRSAEWQRARKQALHDFDWKCTSCGKSLVGLGRAAHVHHRKELAAAPALATEPLNLRPLCRSCHNRIERRLSSEITLEQARPTLPKPSCRVILVCGPVGAGKSTYVEENKSPRGVDSVIDYDDIGREYGYGRNKAPPSLVLNERNKRLAALATAPSKHVCWVTLTAPSKALRSWWQKQLNVADKDMVLLVPPYEELVQRIHTDPTRKDVVNLHIRLIDQWFDREKRNYPGCGVGCDDKGNPTDVMHPWHSLNRVV